MVYPNRLRPAKAPAVAKKVAAIDAPYRITVDRGALDGPAAATIPGVDGVAESDDALVMTTSTPAPVLAALADRDALSGVTVAAGTLEDVFLQLTGREYRA